MDEYIYFELENRRLKMNRENSFEIYIWSVPTKRKEQYWRVLTLSTDKKGYKFIRVNNKGYKLIRIGSKQYKHHRVVYFAHNQSWDIADNKHKSNLIDHIDGSKDNNHISNLRVATKAQNNWNMKNVKGYYYRKDKDKYQAFIHKDNKCIYVGIFKTEEEARQAHLDAKKLHHKW